MDVYRFPRELEDALDFLRAHPREYLAFKRAPKAYLDGNARVSAGAANLLRIESEEEFRAKIQNGA